MEGVNDGEDQRKDEGDKEHWGHKDELDYLWHISHKYASVSTDRLSIDPPIGFARSLVPIMANSSHRRLGPTVLMSRLWRLA